MSYNTNNQNSRMVTGLFPDRASAERAYGAVSDRGYTKDDVNLMMSDSTRKSHFGDKDTELGSKAAEGAGIGAGIGGTIGAVLAGIAAVGTTLVLPGFGLVVAGPLAAALAGAGAGGITGGLIGALIGAGIPEERAAHYEEGIKNGGIVMGVHARSDEDAAHFERSFNEHGASHVIGTGVGAVGGALAGAAIGSAAGPVGTVAGAAIGGITGGMAGKGVGGLVNPAHEDDYWRNNYQTQSHYTPGYTYDDYQPAYALGYNAKSRYTGSYDQNEMHLADEWNSTKGNSRLSWEQAKAASRAAWDKVERAIPGDFDRDGR